MNGPERLGKEINMRDLLAFCNNAQLITILTVCSLFFMAPQNGYAQVEDIELQAEEALADSEAAIKEAEDAKRREEEARAARIRAEKEAAQAMVKARDKQAEARQKIASHEEQILDLQNQQQRFELERQKAEADFAVAVKNIQASEKRLVDQQNVTKAKKGELDLQEKKLNDQIDKLTSLGKDLAKVIEKQQLIEEKKANIKLQLNDSQALLRKRQDENARKRAAMEQKIEDSKKFIADSKVKIERNERLEREIRQRLERLEEDVKLAETEYATAKSQLDDTQERLDKLKESSKPKFAELKARRRDLGQKTLLTRRENLSKKSELRRRGAEVSGGEGASIKVSRRKVRKRLARDCNYRTSTSVKSQRLGTLKKGSVVTLKSANSRWYRLYIKGQSSAYASKACF